ncbi:MAG: tRNA lysidine(34) synthetase TilS [Methyloceanibacter sp.]
MTLAPIGGTEAQTLLAPLLAFPRVALAVSGGPDSVALMQLAASLPSRPAAGPEISVLTVEHGLRPGSRDEAEQAGRLAAKFGLPHTILTWEHEQLQAAGLQARAREARYDLMAAHCHAHSIPALVTAHHLEDQAETFLMRLKRGSGLDGLAAIPERGEWAGIVILRPLLDVPKARLVATLETAGIGYVSDPSNVDPRFERARMRERADALAALGLTPEAIALTARRLRRAREALEQAARDFLACHSEIDEAGYATIGRDALLGAPQEIALRALARLIATVGGAETPLQLAKLEALLEAIQAHPDKAHTLGRCRIAPIKGRLGIFREVRGEGLPEVRLRPGERTLWDNRFCIELGAEARTPVLVKALGEAGLRALGERSCLPPALPRLAGRTLPGCWRGEVLLGLPSLGHAGSPSGLDCRATFVGGARSRRSGTRAPASR